MSGFVRGLWNQSAKLLSSKPQTDHDERDEDEDEDGEERETSQAEHADGLQDTDEEEGDNQQQQQPSKLTAPSLPSASTTAAPSTQSTVRSAASSTAAPADIASVARRVLSLVSTDLSAAEQLARTLPPVDVSSVDPNMLAPRGRYLSLKRRQPQHSHSQPHSQQQQAAVDGAVTASAARRKRKKRRVKYPARVDPKAANAAPPDPERWLPKWERTVVDKKGRRKQRDAPLRGAQGSAASTNLALQHGITTPIGVTGSSAGYAVAGTAATPNPSHASTASTQSATATSSNDGQSTGVEQRADSSRPAAGSAAAAAARKKKKGKK